MSVTVQLNSMPVINSVNRERLWVWNCHVIATLTIQPTRKYLIEHKLLSFGETILQCCKKVCIKYLSKLLLHHIEMYHKKQSIWEAMNSRVKDHRLLLRKEYRCLCTYNRKIHILPDETLYRLVTPRRSKTSSSKVVKVHDFGQASLLNEMIFLSHFFSFFCLACICVCVCV